MASIGGLVGKEPSVATAGWPMTISTHFSTQAYLFLTICSRVRRCSQFMQTSVNLHPI
jgi:hypothetical protein